MLTFRDSNKLIKLNGDPLKTMTKYNFKVDLSNPQDQKLTNEFGKKLNINMSRYDEKVLEIDLRSNYLNHLIS